MITSSDVSFMTTVLAQVGSWTERSGVVYTPGTVSYSGTSVEAGDPPTVTFGTRSADMRVQKVSQKQVESSGGRYFQNDQTISVRGSFANNDLISVESGTYRPVDGPWQFFMGSNLYWQAICREIQ